MTRTFWLAALLAALSMAAHAAPAPLEAYGQLPSLEDVRISPDGHKLAKVTTEGEQREVVIQPLDGDGVTMKLAAGALKLRDIAWAGPNHLIITASTTGYLGPSVISARNEWFRAVDLNLSNRTMRLLGSGPALSVIGGAPVVRFIGGRPFAFVRGLVFVNDRTRTSLLRVDLDGALTTIQVVGFPNTTRFAVDAEGEAIAQTEYDAAKGRWSLDLWKDHQWTEVQYADSPIETPELIGLGRDGSSIAVEFGADDGDVLRELRSDGGAWSDPYPVEDSEELIWDSAT